MILDVFRIVFGAMGVLLTVVGCSYQSVEVSPALTPFVNETQPAAREIPTTIFEASQEYVVLEQTGKTQWTVYAPPQLNQYAFNSIGIDSSGYIWIGGSKEVSSFDGEKWITSTIPNDLLPVDYPRHLSSILVQSSGVVWLGGSDYFLYQFENNVWENMLVDKVSINSISTSPDGLTWFAVRPFREDGYIDSFFMPDGGVLRYDGKHWMSYTSEDGLIDNRVTDIVVDDKGVVWFATPKGISSFDGEKWSNYSLDEICGDFACEYHPFSNNYFAVDRDGSIWIAVDKVALFHRISGEWMGYSNKLIFQDYYPIEGMCISPNGNVWVGKWSDSGVLLSYFDGKQWRVPYVLQDDGTPTFPYAQINDIGCADDGSIWLASASIGVIHYRP